MKRLCSLAPLIGALVLFATVIPAGAGTLSSVSFVEGPVYIANLSATGVDAMKVFIDTPGVVFASPGLSVYADPWGVSGWTTNVWTPVYAEASGPSLNGAPFALDYILNFLIDDTMWPSTATIGVDVYYFQNGLLVDYAGLHYNGPTQFDTSVNNWIPDNLVVGEGGLAAENQTTPEPTTIFLMGSALIGLAVRRRCHKR